MTGLSIEAALELWVSSLAPDTKGIRIVICIMPAGSKVGKMVIEDLIRHGTDPTAIIAACRSPEKLEGANVGVRRADYADQASMEAAFKGVETLVLIPTMTPPAPRCVEHANALSAAKSCGVKRVIFLSLLAASPKSVSAIAPFILFAENATRNSGMEWTILRMGLYLEPVAEWIPHLRLLGRMPYPVREGKTAYVSRRDVARALSAAAKAKDAVGEIYSISAPEAVTMPQLAAAISSTIGEPLPFETCTNEEFLSICFEDEPPAFIANVLLSLYKAIEHGEFDHATNDVEKLTGSPTESVQEFFNRVS